jgi:hypothetical protein
LVRMWEAIPEKKVNIDIVEQAVSTGKPVLNQ